MYKGKIKYRNKSNFITFSVMNYFCELYCNCIVISFVFPNFFDKRHYSIKLSNIK